MLKETENKNINEILDKQKKSKKIQSFKPIEVLILMVSVAIICFTFSWFLCSKMINNEINQDSEKSSLKKFYNEYNNILNKYYGTIDEEKLIENAITGMLDSLDKNTTHISDEESNNFNKLLDGNYNGIGVEITKDINDNVIIIDVFDETPAQKGGVKINDILKKINGEDVSNKTTNEVVDMISESQLITLVVERNGKQIELKIEKDNVELTSVTSKIIKKKNKKIGYIYISIFALNTFEQFESQLNELESQGIDSLIIDVRSNSGGHLSTATNIISLFLDSTHLIYKIEGKEGIDDYYSKGKVTKKYPIVILVDNNSASASEILASALKEQYGAKLVGDKTFGKGTVQELITTSDGFQYKITTQHWLTSEGKWINEEGIDVDYKVDLSIDFYKNPIDENDNQLQKAIEILK